MQYLLGQAGPEATSSFEERLITDKAFYDELIIVEDELIDQYLDGELTEQEREQFETHFFYSPDQQQKIRFGRALHQAARAAGETQAVEPVASPAPSRTKPTLRFPMNLLRASPALSYSVLALLVAAAIGLWVISKQSGGPPGRTVIVTLVPGITRSDNAGNRISNAVDIETIQLRLALANPQDTHRVKLVNADEREIWTGDGVLITDNGRSFVTVDLPARLLPTGSYRVILSRTLPDGSFEESLSYSLSVVP